MGNNPLRRCTAPGCTVLHREGGKCSKHAKTARRQSATNKTKDQWCSNRRWRKLRNQFIADSPLCHDCYGKGRITAAQEVHHIKSRRDHPELAYDVESLMALCKSCHSKRTAQGE